jgi:hypothetical protein
MAGASTSPRKELRNAGSGAPEARIVREEGRCRITIIRRTDETGRRITRRIRECDEDDEE